MVGRSVLQGDHPEAVQFAQWYHSLGMNILPIVRGSKHPATKEWEQWATVRQQAEELNTLNIYQGQGLAAINGIGGWRSLDIDGAASLVVALRFQELLQLPKDYKWVVQTGSGFHLWFLCNGQLSMHTTEKGRYIGLPLVDSTQSFKQVELRWSRCYTILPPSVHPSGKSYEWMRGTPQGLEDVVHLDIHRLEYALSQVASFKQEVTSLPPVQLPTPTKKVFPIQTNWARKALKRELEELRHAPQGMRNTQLNKAAFSLGQLVGSSYLEEEEVTRELASMAQTIGLEEREITATIKSGLNDGIKLPRHPKRRESEPEENTTTREEVVGEDEEQQEEDLPLTEFSPDDAGNGEAMHQLHGHRFLFNKTHDWLVWTGTHWQEDTVAVDLAAVDTLRQRHILAAQEEYDAILKVTKANTDRMNGAKMLFRTHVYEDIERFDNMPDYLNVLNGVIDLRTGELLGHTPKQRFTYVIPLEYDAQASYSLWEDFLAESLGEHETKSRLAFLQLAIGYSITGHTREEKLFYVYGPSRSGKGTFSETMLALLPEPLSMEVDFNTFTARREGDTNNFDLAQMKSSRLVFASESNKYQTLNPGKIKLLTGGNRVRAALKHRDSFTYRPQYKIWLISNHEVNGDPDDDALWGRVHVVAFPTSHLGKEDTTLKDRMRRKENLQGVLRWVTDGAQAWHQEGRLVAPQSVILETSRHRALIDTVEMWLEECCERHSDAWSANEVVMTSYTAWCKINNLEPKGIRSMTPSLKAKGFDIGVQQKDGGTNKRGISGLRILTTVR